MEILKTANEWAKDEVFSSKIFILFGIMFLLATIGFWQLGKTEMAKAFIFPMLIAGTLLLIAGIGFYLNNTSRLSSFETNYKSDPSAFIKSEIARTEKTMNEYRKVAFKVFPLIIMIAASIIIFVNTPTWRAISITIIAFMVCILLLDSIANNRIETYHKQLLQVEKNGRN